MFFGCHCSSYEYSVLHPNIPHHAAASGVVGHGCCDIDRPSFTCLITALAASVTTLPELLAKPAAKIACLPYGCPL